MAKRKTSRKPLWESWRFWGLFGLLILYVVRMATGADIPDGAELVLLSIAGIGAARAKEPLGITRRKKQKGVEL